MGTCPGIRTEQVPDAQGDHRDDERGEDQQESGLLKNPLVLAWYLSPQLVALASDGDHRTDQ
jgi:hypothetical protein